MIGGLLVAALPPVDAGEIVRQGVSAVPEIMEVDGGQPGWNGDNAKMDLFAVGLIGILWHAHQHVSPL
jgi:hypothetical protein